MMVWKMFLLFQGCILRFHVNLGRCNQNVHSHVVMEGGFVQLPQILSSWICCWRSFMTDCTIVNHHVSPPLWETNRLESVPFAPNRRKSSRRHVRPMGFPFSCSADHKKNVLGRLVFHIRMIAKGFPSFFLTRVCSTASSCFKDSPWWQPKYFFLFSPRTLGKDPVWQADFEANGLVKNHQQMILLQRDYPPRNASISNPFERCSLRWWFSELPLTSGICEFIPLRVAFFHLNGTLPHGPLSKLLELWDTQV